MATSSRFNRPYGPSAPGQAPWERLQSQPFGSDSLANRAATPSGRGYYDPERILERVARGRPGTSMQQAVAAMELAGIQESRALAGQQDQPPQTPPPLTQTPAAQQPPQTPATASSPQSGSAETPQTPPVTPNQLGGAFKEQQYLNPRRTGLGGYMDAMTQGWNALGSATFANPRQRKVLEAMGNGTFGSIQEAYNKTNSGKTVMDRWGFIHEVPK